MRTDDPDVTEVEGPPPLKHPADAVIEALAPVVTSERLERIRDVARHRTDRVVVVLDAITDPHNASAVLRSADAFGVQTVHVIVGPLGFRASQGVSKGTHRWIDVVRHADAPACARRLKADGYSIHVATMGGTHQPRDLAAQSKVALVFGNEHRGVSGEMTALADGTFAIPMRGFAESLNVSVAAAIAVHDVTSRVADEMPTTEQRALEARFLMNSVKNADQVIEEHLGNAKRR
ncbi:MAG: RNA methyltransferase [Polyangiales bacterium]